MKTRTEGAAAGRVLLAIEQLGPHLDAMELAVRLAQSFDAELAGVLIEDLNLLRAAGLPFVRELVAYAGEERALDPGLLLDRQRRQFRRWQVEIEHKAGEEGVRTTFHTARGVGVRAALELRLAADLIVFGRRGRGRWGEAVVASRMLVLEDGGDAAARVEAVVARLGGDWPEASVQRMRWRGVEELVAAVRRVRPALVAAPAGLIGASELEGVLERVSCPVVLVV
ncbi:MAG: hypothetical protein P4L83_25640 [Nevskia sp.]|nr:hypothetical protein [Nevskia sp.]